MTVKELIIKLLEEDMDTEVQLTIDEVHYDEHGRCEGYVFDIASVVHEYGGCMIKFNDWTREKVKTMIYAKELSPNLFNTYDDWLANYKSTCNRLPSESEAMAAVVYFLKKEEGNTNSRVEI